MTESEKTIDEIVDRIVEQKLSQRNQAEFGRAVADEVAKYVPRSSRKICQSWLDLRNEISQLVREIRSNGTADNRLNKAHDTVLQAFYSPIRLTLGLSRLDEMTEEQAKIAKEVFDFTKLMILNHNPLLNKEAIK